MGQVQLPDDFDTWKRQIERELRELRTLTASRPPLNRVEDGDFTVANGGSVRIQGGGDMVIDPEGEAKSSDFAPGSSGWRLTDGSAEFNNILLRGGIIGNDALTNPLSIGQGNNNAVNFPVSTTGDATVVSMEFTVPQGFTQFSCMCLGGIAAVNSTASLGYLTARVWIGTSFGDTLYQPASGSGGSAHVTVFKQGMLSGLTPGQKIPVTLRAWVQGSPGWAANASNIASLSVLAFWLR